LTVTVYCRLLSTCIGHATKVVDLTFLFMSNFNFDRCLLCCSGRLID